VTSYGGAQLKRRVLAAGFHAHLAKPLSPETLANVVRNLVRAS
jgi:CheY-like chemotaxis protein